MELGMDPSEMFLPAIGFIESLVLDNYKDHPQAPALRTMIVNWAGTHDLLVENIELLRRTQVN
ncbi:hypothetical protein [Flavihumibacter petaseus]|nr:hypothetical protein [Flavihumibacter petaseus]